MHHDEKSIGSFFFHFVLPKPFYSGVSPPGQPPPRPAWSSPHSFPPSSPAPIGRNIPPSRNESPPYPPPMSLFSLPRTRGVNEPSLGEPRLSRLGSFIFGPGSSSSSSRAWVGCSSAAWQSLNRARARARLDRVWIELESSPKGSRFTLMPQRKDHVSKFRSACKKKKKFLGTDLK